MATSKQALYLEICEPYNFRLVRIEPGEWQAPVRCKLYNSDLYSRPRPSYSALSYAWGSAGVTRQIYVNDLDFKVTVNLESALRHLRHETATRTFWIDALCINQSDVQERTQQVRLMRDIYASATEAVIFLGNGYQRRTKHLPRVSRVAFRNDNRDAYLINDFLCSWAQTTPGPKLVIPQDIFCLIRILVTKDGLLLLRKVAPGNHDSLIEGLRLMLISPWWRRMWVFQEAIVPMRISVQYDGINATWDMFVEAAQVCEQMSEVDFEPELLKVLKYFSKLVLDIEERRRTWTNRISAKKQSTDDSSTVGTIPEILALLRATHARQASDDRDKVFALVGLIASHELLRPDYSKTKQEVYTDAIRYIIKMSQSLDVLCGNLGRKYRSDLPSWVMDWNATVSIDRTSAILSKHYNATHGSRAVFFSAPDEVIKWKNFPRPLKGYDAAVARGWQEPKFPAWAFPIILELEQEFPLYLHAPNSPVFQTARTLASIELAALHIPSLTTNISDVVLEESGGTLKMGGIYAAEVRFVCHDALVNINIQAAKRWIQIHQSGTGAHRPESIEGPHTWRALSFGMKIEHGSLKKLGADGPQYCEEAMKELAASRRLFTTEDGRIGWGPLDIKSNDHIYLLPGGRLPFVLRQSTTAARSPYTLVGDCFLEGCMEGERWSIDEQPVASSYLPTWFWTECSRSMSVRVVTRLGWLLGHWQTEETSSGVKLSPTIGHSQSLTLPPFMPDRTPSTQRVLTWLRSHALAAGYTSDELNRRLGKRHANEQEEASRLDSELTALLDAYDKLHKLLSVSQSRISCITLV